MKRGLVAGFGELIGRETLDALHGFGFRLIRQDVQYLTPQKIAVLGTELSEAGLEPIWIIRDSDQIDALPDGARCEWGNEPDLGDSYVASYLESLGQAYKRANGRLRLSPGPISNLNQRGLDYLRHLMPVIPADMPVAVHRYPNWPGPAKAHEGFLSREHEVFWLRQLIGQRELWVTEVGFHTGKQRVGPWWMWWRKKAWSEAQVHDFCEWELQFWELQGAECLCWYQLNDDVQIPNADYGIRRPNGEWKPWVKEFAI